MNVAAVLESVATAHIRTSSANFSQQKLMARMQGKVVITCMQECLDKHFLTEVLKVPGEREGACNGQYKPTKRSRLQLLSHLISF